MTIYTVVQQAGHCPDMSDQGLNFNFLFDHTRGTFIIFRLCMGSQAISEVAGCGLHGNVVWQRKSNFIKA